MRDLLAIIFDDPKAFILDFIGSLLIFAGLVALYVVFACFVP